MLAKNEFQLYEFPEIAKMQCQNASNDGCGGYGNNWCSIYLIAPPITVTTATCARVS